MSVESQLLPPTKPSNLTQLVDSRLSIAFVALILQVLVMIPIMGTSLLAVNIFNLPAVSALLLCIAKQPTFSSLKTQKTLKLLLKIGIAKAVGGLLLAAYIGLKYVSMPKESVNMRLCAIYFCGSAIMDALYSLAALSIIRKTKEIIRVLRREERKARKLTAYVLETSALDSSDTGSVSSLDGCTCASSSTTMEKPCSTCV